jgi:hypothetical protein
VAQVEEFTLAYLSTQIPTASRQLIKKVLANLKGQAKSGWSAMAAVRGGG